MNSVWALTTIRRVPDEVMGRYLVRGRRTVGLFETKEEAETILVRDIGDLDEAGYYQYAVIEQVDLCLYPCNHGAGETQNWWEHFQDKGWQRGPVPPAWVFDPPLYGKVLRFADIG